MANNRITANLSVAVLEVKYPTIDLLQAAITGGELRAELELCAAELHDGDYDAACEAANRTWTSNVTNAKKALGKYAEGSVMATVPRTKLARAEALVAFVRGERAIAKKAKTAGNGKPYWLYTAEDILAVALEDLDKLTSIRDGMASKLSKYPETIEQHMTLDEFKAIYKVACDRRSEAAALAKENKAKAEKTLSPEATALVEKLKAGKSLTKKDKALLAEVLELLGK